MMKLYQLLRTVFGDALLNHVQQQGIADLPIAGMALDSRQISAGDAFIAIRGQHGHGLDFIQQAISNGAVVVFSDEHASSPDVAVPVLVVPELTKRLGELAACFFAHPSQSLKLIGVTGTNGKSSCVHFLAQCWERSGLGTAGYIGTLGVGRVYEAAAANCTTPDVVSLQSALANLSAANLKLVALEVSSHGLDQGRVDGCTFAAGIFTNLSHDHLDYHGDMSAYAAAKSKLFTAYPCPLAVINVDDEYGRDLAFSLSRQAIPGQRVIRYSATGQSAEVQAELIEMNRYGLTMHVTSPWGEQRFTVAVAGRFQVANIAAVMATLAGLGCDWDQLVQAVTQLQAVPGRMQTVSADTVNSAHILVDYAHTPEALAQALQTARELTQGDLWCVFGCGGDRDSAKRPEMGRIACQWANHVVVTSDNPRGESPQQIIQDIVDGIGTTQASVKQIPERGEAIHWAIQHAAANDVVLIAGKGHENYQEIAGQRYPFDDVDCARRALECAA